MRKIATRFFVKVIPPVSAISRCIGGSLRCCEKLLEHSDRARRPPSIISSAERESSFFQLHLLS